MPFPDTAILDAFDRADGDPGSNWSAAYTANGKPVIDTNRLKNVTGTAANSGAIWNPQTFTDCEVYCTIAVLPSPSTEEIFLTARAMNTARSGPPPEGSGWSGYQLRVLGTGAIESRKYDGVGVTVIEDPGIPGSFGAGSAVGLKIEGTTLTIWHKPSGGSWIQIGTGATDSDYPSGYIGVEFDEATCRVDDFGGGSLVAETAAILRPAMVV